MLPTKIAIFSQNKQRTTFNTHSEPRENVTFLCVGSFLCVIRAFRSAPVVQGRVQMCVFFFTGRRRRRGASDQSPPPGGGSSVNCCGCGKMDNLSRIFIIHIPTGKALVARWFDWQMPGRGVKRKITSWEEKSAVRYPVRASSLLGRSRGAVGIVLGNCCYV